jgi:hypothetical protein
MKPTSFLGVCQVILEDPLFFGCSRLGSTCRWSVGLLLPCLHKGSSLPHAEVGHLPPEVHHLTCCCCCCCCCCPQFQTTDQAFDHFDRLLGQLLRVTRVTGVTSWPSLRGFLEDFSVTQPHVLARSALFLQVGAPGEGVLSAFC